MKRACLAAAVAAAIHAAPLFAEDIIGVQPAALDQPRINAAISLGPLNSGTLLFADFGAGNTTFNVQAFFDTGASGVLLSTNTAEFLEIQREMAGANEVIFSDVGVAGSDQFAVSQELYISLAPYTPEVDADNFATYQTVYNQSFGPIRTQIGPVGIEPDPVLGDLDVFGVPLMRNKVVVMDPKPVNSFVETMRTEVYNPGHAAIPTTSRHVLMTKGSFDRFTQLTPSGAPGPTLGGNPFIGRDPNLPAAPGDTPGVTMTVGTFQTEGSFLFDTGAAASMISTTIANSLNVRYAEGTQGTDAPVLEFISDETIVPDQFTLSIGGIGGTIKVAGFFLDTLMLPTIEGQSDPNANINYVGAPVLVHDISLLDPSDNSTLTLDGIFGMNFLVASANIFETQPLPVIGALAPGAYDWITYEHDFSSTHAMLGLEINPNPPLPGQLAWFGPLFGGSGNWDTTTANWFDPENIFGGQVAYNPSRPVTFTNVSSVFDIFIPQPVSPVQMLIANDGTVSYTFSGAAITGSGAIIKQGGGSATFFNSNTYTGQTDIQNGTLVFAAQQNIGAVLVRSQGNLIMETSQRFEGLRLLSGKATLTAGGAKYLQVDQLEITNTGQLEINTHDIIINNKEVTLPEDIRDYLQAGRNDGAWNGPGIRSAAAAANPNLYSIGYADNALLGRTSFHGLTLGASSLIVQFTYAGDANLDGRVNLIDLQMLAVNWMQQDSFWLDGDFNYDGVVNAVDLGILARTWQQGVDNPLPSQSIYDSAAVLGLPETAVPEPISLGFVAAIGLLTTRRVRRCRPARI